MDAWYDNGTEIFSRHWSCLLGIKKNDNILITPEFRAVLCNFNVVTKTKELLNECESFKWWFSWYVIWPAWNIFSTMQLSSFTKKDNILINSEFRGVLYDFGVVSKTKEFLKWFCTFQMMVSRMPDMKYLLNNEVPFSAWKMLIFWSLMILDL